MGTDDAHGARHRLFWFIAIWAASVLVAGGGVWLLKRLLSLV